MRKYNIPSDFIQTKALQPIVYKQYDNGDKLVYEPYDDGEKINLTDETVLAFFELVDGTVIEKTCEIINGNAVATLDNNILSKSGNLTVEFTIYKDGSETSTRAIFISVEKSINRNEAIETIPKWDIVQQILDLKASDGSAIEEKINVLNEAVEDKFNELAAAAQVNSEVVLARGGEATLGQRLDKVSSSLAEKAYHIKGKGDGVTDDTQSFIDALAVSDVIFVPRGKTYLIGDVDVIGKTIIGHGTIKKKATSESAFHIKGNGTVISGIIFNGQMTTVQPSTDIKLGDGASNIRIMNNTFNSPIYSGIAGAVDTLQGGTPYTTRVSGLIISNNVFKSGYARPIYLHSVDNITIESNIIRDCNYDAIRLRENDGYCVINANQFINIGSPSWLDDQTRDAVDTYWSGETLTITNNIIRKTAFAGFDIKGVVGTNKSRKIVISNNQIEDTRYNGIHIYGDVDNHLLYIDSVIISDNIITGCNQNKAPNGSHGIHMKGCAKYVNIHDNIVSSCFGRGIFINNDYGGSIHKSFKVTGNICVNNGQQGVVGDPDAGISITGVDGVIIADNICENDTELPNPYQNIGIYFRTTDVTASPVKTGIIRGNICRNNISKQIYTDLSGNRANNIAVFSDNIQVGTGAINRATWQDQRSIFFGVDAPTAGDGTFRKGDIIFNVGASASGKVGWVCVTAGNAGTWKAFGAIDT
jgi:parallel beta-helix repeat protein